MAVVRREGDWRLEKQGDGIYEITYDGRTEMKVFTADYDPGMFDDRYDIGTEVHEVDSFSEAESLFKEVSKEDGQSPLGGFGHSKSTIGGGSLNDIELSQDTGEFENIPIGGVALILTLVGGYAVYMSGFVIDSPVFLFGTAMAMGGILIFVWAFVLFKTQGASEAWHFLTAVEESDREPEKDSSSNESERTSPAPQSLKDDLYFDRANQSCEWCADRVDQPEVHHIKPRSEGGENTPSNLIVLCPSCHAKADSGGISRTKLRSKVRRIAKT